MVTIIVVAVAVLALGGLVYWSISKNKQAKPAPQPVPEPQVPPEPQPPVAAPVPIEPKPLPKVEAPTTGDTRRYVRVIKGGSIQANGLYNLRVELRQGDTLLDSVVAVSGGPRTQFFRYASQGKAQSMEPIPECYYNLGMPEWKGARNDFSKSWGPGLGPMWEPINPTVSMERGDFGFHFDENQAEAPGSAGCIVFQNKEYLKTFVSWFDDPRTAPKLLVVNWGLGSVETKGMGYNSYGQKFDPHELTPWEQLVAGLKKKDLEFNAIKSIVLAQWILESGRGTSDLAKKFFNFGGIKYREELISKLPGASKILYKANDGEDYYFALKSPEQYVDLYFAFIGRSIYNGWREAAAKGPEAYIRFIAQCGYMGGPSAPQADKDAYVMKILKLWPEAQLLLGEVKPTPVPQEPGTPAPADGKKDLVGLKWAIDVGHGMYAEEGGGDYDPGACNNGYTEFALNKTQGLEIKRLLELRGAKVDVYCYEKGMTNERLTLGHKGEKGKGHHGFTSLHHNALDGRGPLDANYSCAMLALETDGRKRHTSLDLAFAKAVASELGKVMGYGLPSGGILRRGLGLFYNRMATWSDCKVACLVESYFIDANALQGKDMTVLSKKAAGAIANAIANFSIQNKLF